MIKVSLDTGFGSLKGAIMDGDTITEKFKDTLSYVELDPRAGAYDDRDLDIVRDGERIYRIGASAKYQSDQKVIDVVDYKTMKLAAPLIVKKYLRKYPRADKILISLSLAFSSKAAEFSENLNLVLGDSFKDRVMVVPQGVASKIALDHVGLDPDGNVPINLQNYMIIDVGFLTLDNCMVINGRTIPANRDGIEGEGVIKLAKFVHEKLLEQGYTNILFPQMREILDNKGFMKRGHFVDCSAIIDQGIKYYLNELYKVIEEHYGNKLDVLPNMIIVGGGAEIIRSHIGFFNNLYDKEFALIPKNSAEFYNAIGALYL